MSKKSNSSLVKTVLSIAAILIVFIMVLRAALAPLYQEIGAMEQTQLELAQSRSVGSSNGVAQSGSSENVNINIGSGGWLNWTLGWIWGGPGWYSGPDYGWWGANLWNGWKNWWGGGGWNGQNRVWNGGFNETINRSRSTEINSNRTWDSRGGREGDANRLRDENTNVERRDSNRTLHEENRPSGGDNRGDRR